MRIQKIQWAGILIEDQGTVLMVDLLRQAAIPLLAVIIRMAIKDMIVE